MNREQWQQKRKQYSEVPGSATKALAAMDAGLLGTTETAVPADHAARAHPASTWRSFPDRYKQGKS
jgi:hypothetical protein